MAWWSLIWVIFRLWPALGLLGTHSYEVTELFECFRVSFFEINVIVPLFFSPLIAFATEAYIDDIFKFCGRKERDSFSQFLLFSCGDTTKIIKIGVFAAFRLGRFGFRFIELKLIQPAQQVCQLALDAH